MAIRGGTGRRARCVAAAPCSGRRWLALLAAAAFAACASGGGDWRGGRFAHAKLGGSIGDVAAIESGWRQESAPDATLAFRHADGSRASWLRECRGALAKSKALVDDVDGVPMDEELLEMTAKLIADQRLGDEGQEGVAAFLEKRKPGWAV